ncbi:MAG: methionine synthase [Deltaproteobacteria bacterium]|nr:methionine synthase [Deltaproteobacteria bacterium]
MFERSVPIFFRSMAVTVPKAAIYSRLGYRKSHTQIPAEHLRQVEQYIDQALELIELKGSAVVMPVESIDETTLRLENGIVFESAHLAGMMKGCGSILLMGATAGKRIMDEIQSDAAEDNLSRGVVLDAAASEMTDEALDWITGYVNQGLRRNAKRLTEKRYSAGYGDFALENQKIMYDLLKMNELGVSITGSYLLIPEKSVTALAGVFSSSP